MSSLKRTDERAVTVPSLPALVTNTASPPTACSPLMPANIGGRIIEANLDGVAFAGHANNVRSNIDIVISLVRWQPAALPKVVLSSPVVLFRSAKFPATVLRVPLRLLRRTW